MNSRAPLDLPEAAALAVPDDLPARLAALGVSLEASVLGQLGHYLGLLLAMNARMNLTAITDPGEAWSRHVLDALSLVPLLPGGAREASLLDVGSGGGVPAIPVALARPDLRVTMLEATQKKAAFLTDVARALGLARVSVIAARAETLPRPVHHGAYAVVTARAVGRLAVLAPWTLPFVRPGGCALLIKGQRADEELAEARAEIRRLGAVHERTVETPTGRIVVLRKL